MSAMPSLITTLTIVYSTAYCAGNSSETGEFPVQMASNAENASIWWRHHDTIVPVPASQPWRIDECISWIHKDRL